MIRIFVKTFTGNKPIKAPMVPGRIVFMHFFIYKIRQKG